MASFYVNIDVEALFCRCSTRFNFHCVHSRGRIWNPPLRTANSVAFCLPPTSAGWGHPALHLPKKGNVGRPALWPPCPLPATVNLPCNPPTLTPRRKASLVKGRCRACEAEGFLLVCGCDSVQGIARRNPSGRLRRPPAPLLALRATSPGTGESVFDKGGFSSPTLNFTSNFTLAKSGKVCYNLIAYRFSGKYSRNPNQKRRVPPHVRTPVGNPCGFLW
jgi:hypothetical protein